MLPARAEFVKDNRTGLMSHEPLFLIADDDASIRKLLKHYLEPLGGEVIVASDGSEALTLARERLPDVALLDVVMPGKSGWDVCQLLKGVERTSGIRVVLVTGKGDVKDRLTGLQAGADDYLVKPFTENDVTWRISRLLELKKKDKDSQATRIRRLLHDDAVGLPTVSSVLPRVKEMLIENGAVSIVHLDVEQIESIEAEYGWAFFDEFLRVMAEAISAEAESRDAIACVSRVGSSGFYVFAANDELPASEMSTVLKQRLEQVVAERYPSFSEESVAFFAGEATISYAPQIRLERQIYRGLQESFDAVRDEEQRSRRQLISEMSEIIRDNKVRVLFQPIVESSDLSIFGYELLTRGPARSSFRNSDILFEFARVNGLAWDLERVAIHCMVEKLQQDPAEGKAILVNLEAETVEAFVRQFDELMSVVAEKPERFVFELTERAAIDDYSSMKVLLSKLRSKGVSIAIDDAGSGYASLEAIASLAPDYLKITKGLISTLADEPIKQDLMKLLVELAGKIGARTIAEGIETEEEYIWCRDLGIDLLQGYYFARPEADLIGALEGTSAGESVRS